MLCILQVAATTLHHKALQAQQLASDAHASSSNREGAAAMHQQPTASLASGSQPVATAAIEHSRVADVAVKREDEELHQKRAAERRGLPTNVDGFK